MPKKNASRTQVARYRAEEDERFAVEKALDLTDLPVMPQTILLLELELQEPCVDLHATSQLVLSDLGATLQILRLAKREFGDAPGRPARIEDCISALGLDACMKAVSAQPLPRDGRQAMIAAIWEHSREVARYSKLIADEMPGVNPEEAYLVGLLHAIGLLGPVLGWTRKMAANEVAIVGFGLAKRWALPPCVMEFFSERSMAGGSMVWSEMVRRAHQLSSSSSVNCPFRQGPRPHLLRIV